MKCPRRKLPDLYLIDSPKLLREVERIHLLAIAVPPTVETHAPLQSVLDALWHLRRDMEDILKVQRDIHSSFAQKAADLAEANQPAQIGLKVVQLRES
jgi:hypothetical protein